MNTDSKVNFVGTTLLIHADRTNVNSGGYVYFSGYLTDTDGNGISGQTGYITANGQYLLNSNFQTRPDGSWGMWITFYGAGTSRYVAVNCDGLQAGLEIQVS